MSTTDEDTTAAWKRVVDGSEVVSTVRRMWTGEFGTSENARSSQLIERGTQWLTGSALYQWLTAEPEPDVIVIDLRETWTVGPLVKLLDRIVLRALPYWHSSRVNSGVDALVGLAEQAAETRYGQAIASVLAPPGPPGGERGDEPNSAGTEATQQSNQPASGRQSADGTTDDVVDGGDKSSHGR